jgi:hypothetical protein
MKVMFICWLIETLFEITNTEIDAQRGLGILPSRLSSMLQSDQDTPTRRIRVVISDRYDHG